ncbi:MAG: methyltransferase domain-containing protein [Gilvibacter sp.]
MNKYIHTESIHNADAAGVLVPLILERFKVSSVVDFGCGLGNFLKLFKQHGVAEVLGLDGSWTELERLYKNIDPAEFREVDLEKPIHLDKKYDLVISLEVAEHLSSKSETIFVESLIAAGDTIVFSAAIPDQGGQNHINEKWLSDWAKIFEPHGFVPVDLFRKDLWNNESVFWWYRQNILVFVPKDAPLANLESTMLDIVHPELFLRKTTLLQNTTDQLHSLQSKINKEREHYKNLKKSPLSLFKLFLKSIFKR